MRPLTASSRRALLLCVIISWCGGCSLKLPPPRTYQLKLSDRLLPKRLCSSEGALVALSLDGASQASGAISCDHAGATVVLLNNVGMRVRTVTISASGEARDEVSYLSERDIPTEELLSLLAAARESADHIAKSHDTIVRIHVSEPTPTQRAEELGQGRGRVP